MLENIRISNFAIIDKSSVNFTEGFNVLTGETGAGKSLIVDALLFLTGIRADKSFIKSGSDSSRVEGVFSVEQNNTQINNILESIGLINEGTIIISRQFNLNGKNECRINGELVTLNIIRKLSSLIIDIFGQNDSQVLLDSSNHLRLIDEIFSNELISNKNKLQELSSELQIINNDIKQLGGLDIDRENNIRFLEFQIDEITSANLEIGQEEELKSKISIMQNSEKILSSLDNILYCLDGEYSIENSIKTAINHINTIENYDSELTPQKERLQSIRYELQDITDEINSKKNSITYSDDELDRFQDQLIQIKDLERKYGNTIEDVLSHRDKLKEQLDKLLNADIELERLRLNKNSILKQIYDVCIQLRNIRTREIAKFKTKIENELKLLGMKNARFDVSFLNDITLDNIENIFNENGADNIEFLFSANLGVEPRPLDKIISGGEMSRFMLAFKSLQNSNTQKTCIFDEIDTGIGGDIGNIVGKKICEISKNTQVICITHLAQIATYGDSNFKIEKTECNNSTQTSVRPLNATEKTEEIARMLGSGINETSCTHAKEMIDDAIAFKAYLK